MISCRNLKIFELEFGNFHKEILVSRSVRVFGFWGRKTEIDLPESVSSGKDLLPSTRVVGSASVRSDPLSFFVWVESLEFECIGQH